VREDSASRLSAHETTGWKPVDQDRQDACLPARLSVLAGPPDSVNLALFDRATGTPHLPLGSGAVRLIAPRSNRHGEINAEGVPSVLRDSGCRKRGVINGDFRTDNFNSRPELMMVKVDLEADFRGSRPGGFDRLKD